MKLSKNIDWNRLTKSFKKFLAEAEKEEEAPKVTIVAQYPMPPVPAITDCSSPYGDLWHYGKKE